VKKIGIVIFTCLVVLSVEAKPNPVDFYFGGITNGLLNIENGREVSVSWRNNSNSGAELPGTSNKDDWLKKMRVSARDDAESYCKKIEYSKDTLRVGTHIISFRFTHDVSKMKNGGRVWVNYETKYDIVCVAHKE